MERDSAPLQSVFISETTALPSPDKVVDAVLCYQPDVPRHSPLVRLPNMSPAQEPRARRHTPARGCLYSPGALEKLAKAHSQRLCRETT
jgi:hypothetical protein